MNWSGQWDLNPRHQPWQGCALPLSYTRIDLTEYLIPYSKKKQDLIYIFFKKNYNKTKL